MPMAKSIESPAYALITQEIALLITNANEMRLEPYDIISDRKSVAALSLLYTSMVWSRRSHHHSQSNFCSNG